VPNVLVTAAFGEAQLDRLRRVSPRLTVARADPETAALPHPLQSDRG